MTKKYSLGEGITMTDKYSLKQDHANIKKQIKGWERSIDKVMLQLELLDLSPDKRPKDVISSVVAVLDGISNDMMAINM